MHNNKVIVLLSTYNGEKYLSEQLDSIFNQDYNNFELFVRDDGSTDNTINILNAYKKKHKNMSIEFGNNIGFFKSFLWLLKNSEKADFYSFCDQDDLWEHNKISFAIEKTEKENKKNCLLYFSDYYLCDENLNILGISEKINNSDSLERAIIANHCPLGFNTVINYSLKKKIEELDLDNLSIWGHDYWCYLLGITFGKIIYDNRPTARYRRHNSNVSTYEKKFLRKQFLRFKKFILNNDYDIIKKTNLTFFTMYKSEMDMSKFKIFQLYTNRNIINNICKCFYRKRYSESIIDELAIRILLLVGKL